MSLPYVSIKEDGKRERFMETLMTNHWLYGVLSISGITVKIPPWRRNKRYNIVVTRRACFVCPISTVMLGYIRPFTFRSPLSFRWNAAQYCHDPTLSSIWICFCCVLPIMKSKCPLITYLCKKISLRPWVLKWMKCVSSQPVWPVLKEYHKDNLSTIQNSNAVWFSTSAISWLA